MCHVDIIFCGVNFMDGNLQTFIDTDYIKFSIGEYMHMRLYIA